MKNENRNKIRLELDPELLPEQWSFFSFIRTRIFLPMILQMRLPSAIKLRLYRDAFLTLS